jgi:hypothetical protein
MVDCITICVGSEGLYAHLVISFSFLMKCWRVILELSGHKLVVMNIWTCGIGCGHKYMNLWSWICELVLVVMNLNLLILCELWSWVFSFWPTVEQRRQNTWLASRGFKFIRLHQDPFAVSGLRVQAPVSGLLLSRIQSMRLLTDPGLRRAIKDSSSDLLRDHVLLDPAYTATNGSTAVSGSTP